MIEGELLKRLDRVEAMLEGLCMGMASRLVPQPPRELTEEERTARFVAAAVKAHTCKGEGFTLDLVCGDGAECHIKQRPLGVDGTPAATLTDATSAQEG